MALKFLGPNGGSTAGAIKCFEYVTMMKNRGVNIRVTSNSWGGADYSAALKTAMDTAGNAGVIHMTASGNDGLDTDSNASYPSNFNSPSVMSVAASDAADIRPSWSNYGRTTVDLAAPGNEIVSTIRGGYASYNGTSMATPHVAGAAALLAAYQPSLSVAQLKSTLMSTVDVLPQWTGNVVSNGRLNLARAIASVAPTTSGPAPTPTTPPVTNPSPQPVVTPSPTPPVPTQPTPPAQPTPRPRKITAKSDRYTFNYQQSTWTVAAPGVLTNDRGGNGTLAARLIDDAYWGTVALAADGSFTYTADPSYPPLPGDTDSFTYQATDGVSFSKVVAVKLKFAATSSYAAKAHSAASTVTLTSATAQAASDTTLLFFDGKISEAKAGNRANYSVTVNDEDVAVRSVIFNSSANSVLLRLAKKALRPGDIVQVSWEDLKDADKRDVTDGSLTVTAG
jgi:VCBS repeat-containing protein